MIGVELIDEEGNPMPAARMANIFEGVKVRKNKSEYISIV